MFAQIVRIFCNLSTHTKESKKYFENSSLTLLVIYFLKSVALQPKGNLGADNYDNNYGPISFWPVAYRFVPVMVETERIKSKDLFCQRCARSFPSARDHLVVTVRASIFDREWTHVNKERLYYSVASVFQN